jgi:hypothetical protein
MNEDYLWDKSGEPDPQVQQLEEILGSLRYQPKPFEISRDVPAPQRRNYFPLIAVAAMLLVALLAGGIWLQVRRSRDSQPHQARLPVPPSVEEKTVATPEPKKNADKPELREGTVAVNKKRRNRSTALGKREREEALAAKQQLMLALRLASEKLNLAHKKIQPANQIKNQHRVG